MTFTRKLGRSGIQVSALGMGCWAIGGPFWAGETPLGWGEVDDAESIRAAQTALDLGVNFFDTANVYGAGHSERVLACAFAGKHKDVVIATKFNAVFDETTRQVLGSDSTPAGIVNLIFLPVNYLFELGFFFALALLWLQIRQNKGWENNPYFIAESILIVTITILLSFVYSNLIAINDLGIRGWIPLQFMLIIWAMDVLEKRLGEKILLTPSIFRRFPGSKSLGTLLTILFTVGIATSLLEITITRTWPLLTDFNIPGFPNELSPDTQLGRRTYAARLAYNYVRDTLPTDIVIQDNPTVTLNRPGGLYGTRQVAIADRTAYGVPANIFKSQVEQVGKIFETENVKVWDDIDQGCQQHFINVIITNDTDPLWSSLPTLEQLRQPLYRNQYYALFGCGDFSNFNPEP